MRVAVAEFISANPVTIRAAQSARAAAKLMRDRKTEFLIVLDGEDVLGVITAQDLAVRVMAENGAGHMRIDAICTRDPLVASPTDPLVDVLDRMRERDVGAVPIVEDGRLVGVFSIDDLGTVRDRPDAAPATPAPSADAAPQPVVVSAMLPGNVRTLPTAKNLPVAKSAPSPPRTDASA
ncbi:CBS domain-containing protein [Tessaracoccus rhinocerotis]|uniref:CBS domain-containing protein n=1 Tax=Tessaracoccus rhinocerotis TaxID=1689449 RepID=A0A553K0Y2_9ACTN|nr:CBS domain-containing protein [Tessaracoccus rhinocerotis]TRY18358.1 CBS domain-containing protein [Tessaracoccus rhinocerotis]